MHIPATRSNDSFGVILKMVQNECQRHPKSFPKESIGIRVVTYLQTADSFPRWQLLTEVQHMQFHLPVSNNQSEYCNLCQLWQCPCNS